MYDLDSVTSKELRRLIEDVSIYTNSSDCELVEKANTSTDNIEVGREEIEQRIHECKEQNAIKEVLLHSGTLLKL